MMKTVLSRSAKSGPWVTGCELGEQLPSDGIGLPSGTDSRHLAASGSSAKAADTPL